MRSPIFFIFRKCHKRPYVEKMATSTLTSLTTYLPPKIIEFMKHLWPYPLFLIIFLIVAGCNRDKEDPLPEPMPSEPSIEFEDKITPAPVMSTQGGTTTLTFTAAEAWTADVNAITRALDWVSVSPTSGEAGTVNLQITAQPNETYDDRNAAIVLQCGSTKKPSPSRRNKRTPCSSPPKRWSWKLRVASLT